MTLKFLRETFLNKDCAFHIISKGAVEVFGRGTFYEIDDFGQFIGEGGVELLKIDWERATVKQISNEEIEIVCDATRINICIPL